MTILKSCKKMFIVERGLRNTVISDNFLKNRVQGASIFDSTNTSWITYNYELQIEVQTSITVEKLNSSYQFI